MIMPRFAKKALKRTLDMENTQRDGRNCLLVHLNTYNFLDDYECRGFPLYNELHPSKEESRSWVILYPPTFILASTCILNLLRDIRLS